MPEGALTHPVPGPSAQVMRLLIPGSLCDGRLFADMTAQWPPNRSFRLASLDAMRDPDDWWHVQLATLPQRFDVLGFSLGGLLAQALLRTAPERIRSLVLMASSADAAGTVHQQRWQLQQRQWQENGPRELVRQMAHQASPALLTEHLALLQDMAQSTCEAAFMAQGQFNAQRPSGLQALAEHPVPLCLISGGLDPWCTAEVQGRILNARPDAHHAVIQQAGHYLPLEAPTPVAQTIESFLNSLPLDASPP